MDREGLLAFIKAIAGHENIIAVPRVFVTLTDDWGTAAMLNQLIYWSSRTKNGSEWIYKSLSDWQDEVGGITRHTINKLRELPYVETDLRKANGAPTLHYRIDFEKLMDALSDILKMELPKTTNPINENSKSLTETTSDITTNIKGLTPVGVDPEYVEAGKEFEEKAKGISPDKRQVHNEMVKALMDATELDMKLRMNSGRIYKASKELREAGYSPEDVIAFKDNWKQDWRYKRDKKPPAISIIQAEIKKAERKQSTEEWLAERRRKSRESLEAEGIDISQYDYIRKD